MKVDGCAGGIKGWDFLREQARDHTGQNISGACCRQCGVSQPVDASAPGWLGDNCAGAFEYKYDLPFAGLALRQFQAVQVATGYL